MKPANYAPVYCALYPALADLVRRHGYALAIHGTLGRDMDLIAVPWVLLPDEPKDVVNAITATFSVKQVGAPEVREHGRLIYTLSLAFGECFIDLSFTPNTVHGAPQQAKQVPEGYVLVPIEPTNEMTSAMADALEDPENERSSWDLAENMYQAMLAASRQGSQS